MLAPGPTEYPDHRVTTEPMDERVEVFMGGEKVAETNRALLLLETGIEPKIYIPQDDLSGIELLKFDEYVCPFKGRAELYDVKHGSRRFKNAAWSYKWPYDDFNELKGLVAFDPDKVQLIRVTG